MDRVWDTSNYQSKFSLNIFKFKVIQGHEVKEGLTWKFCFWATWYMFMGQFFVKNVKNDPRTFFERPKSDKFWKPGKYRNRREQRKNDPFRPSKHQNSVIFQDIYLKFCTRVHLTSSFTYIPVFWKFENFPKYFENNIFDYFSKFWKFEIAA